MFRKSVFAGALLWAAASIVYAGPPLICHPHDIGTAKSLPWKIDGNKWDTPDPNYQVRQLSADTLQLLQPGVPILVRTETLRRAAVYGQQNHAAATELLAALRARVEMHPDAVASFDYGCFLACLQQMKTWYKEDLTGGLDATGYVKTAAAQMKDPDIQSVLTAMQSFR